MDKFCQFLTELSDSDTSIFSFLDNNFSKYQLGDNHFENFIWGGISMV